MDNKYIRGLIASALAFSLIATGCSSQDNIDTQDGNSSNNNAPNSSDSSTEINQDSTK